MTCSYMVHVITLCTYVLRVMHLVAFVCVYMCVCVCVCVCVTKKNTYLHAYQSNVCEKDAYCSLIHFMLPEMLA